MSCCACCYFYPEYKKKVDKIYPRNPEGQLIKNEVDKLQYYVQIHPEKLSKIGEYLYQNLKWGLNGTYKHRNYVKNTVEAVDKILQAITPQNLNYYASNYLKIIQKLLEQGGSGSGGGSGGGAGNNGANIDADTGLEYQKMAADLFHKFCEKEASNLSTTNYNLNYDTFVGQFSRMCYNNNKDERKRAEICSSGLQCLGTMVKRLVPEDSLRAGYLWDNMDKIVPALLFVMHENYKKNAARDGATANGRTGLRLNDSQTLLNDADLDLDRYLYGNIFPSKSGGSKLASANSADRVVDEEGVVIEEVTVKFRKGNNNSNELSRSNLNLDLSARLAQQQRRDMDEEQSTPSETGAMFNTNENLLRADTSHLDPDHEAKLLLKNLASKADYTTISKIVTPILAFLDDNQADGWEQSRFVRIIFLIVMYNVKQQHAIVIKDLMKHLDTHINSPARLKCCIIKAISICIQIAAIHSVGTSGQIIEIFTNLLKHLSNSVKEAAALGARTDEEQQRFQREIVCAMGQFTSHLPDYAKNDVIMFITRRINTRQFNYIDIVDSHARKSSDYSFSQANQPGSSGKGSGGRDSVQNQIRARYFECLSEICMKYKPTQLFGAFSSITFFEDFLQLSLCADWTLRLKVHQILHHLMDKYQLMPKINEFRHLLSNSSSVVSIVDQQQQQQSKDRLKKSASVISCKSASVSSLKEAAGSKKPAGSESSTSLKRLTRNQTYLSQLDLEDPRLMASKDDVQFMRKCGRLFLSHLNENLFFSNNRRENFESVFKTICLFLIGLYNEREFLVDLVRFGFHVQELALLNFAEPTFSFESQCNIHKFVCAYFLMLSKSSGVGQLYNYCSGVCETRKKPELFRHVFPEYILLDPTKVTWPQQQQQQSDSTTTSGVESSSDLKDVDFKRSLENSASSYMAYVQQSSSGEMSEPSKPSESGGAGTEANAGADGETGGGKRSLPELASWLFDKKLVSEILESAGHSTKSLFSENKDFSLAVSYLQQTVVSLPTVLRFRSPHSVSYDSLSALNSGENQQMGNSNDINHHHHSHKRGGSYVPVNSGLGHSSSANYLGSSPRRSLDAESNLGDETSYDSASQFSVEQGNYGMSVVDPPMKFYIESALNGGERQGSTFDNQMTVNSIATLRDRMNSNQVNSQDLVSFDTLKRVLFNSNYNLDMINNNGHRLTASEISGSAETGQTPARMNQLKAQPSANSDQVDQSTNIITDFKQKTFEELKQNLTLKNQHYHNNEKYNQVFELISKEITSNSSGANLTYVSSSNTLTHSPNLNSAAAAAAAGGYANNAGAVGVGSQNGIGGGNLLLSKTSTSQLPNGAGMANGSANLVSVSATTVQPGPGSLQKELNSHQQKMVPLNDIEFPQLFMY